jgi:serine/threonine protein phosphatase 1
MELILNIQKERHVIAIKGNHEEWMLETMNDYTKHSWIIGMEGLDTIKSYSETAENEIRKELTKYGREIIFHSRRISYDKFFDSIPNEHLDFLMNMKDYHVEDDYIFVHAGISVHEEDMNMMDTRKMRWGFEGFPEEYKGSRKIVYGHFSRKAILKNNKVVPYVRNRTICIDTGRFDILTIFVSPSDKIVQIGRPNR